MACTSFHKPTNKWLTAFNRDSKAGDVHTISVSSASKLSRWLPNGTPRTCEFTSYLLGAPVAHDDHGYPLFDLNETPRCCALDHGDSGPDASRILEVHALPALPMYPARAAA